jgi:cytochrome o ubiquinol oxidase subunit 2
VERKGCKLQRSGGGKVSNSPSRSYCQIRRDWNAQLRLIHGLCSISFITVVALATGGCSQGVLDPRGPIGIAEKTILLNSVGIMLTIVVPVIVATLAVAWWFRASNGRARYRPAWTYSGKVEIVVWSIPAMIILLLGGIAWTGSHDLDPARPIESPQPPVEINVVALDWKWLFIYPRQGIASVNRMTVPAGTPIALKLTSATVMNSFFVPQLGSQIYTMAGMTTRLHLLADHSGQFPGLSAQFSGDGFSGMRFVVDAVAPESFAAWADEVRSKGAALDARAYEELALPSKSVPPMTFGTVDPDLFRSIAEMRFAGSPVPPGEDAPELEAHSRKGH